MKGKNGEELPREQSMATKPKFNNRHCTTVCVRDRDGDIQTIHWNPELEFHVHTPTGSICFDKRDYEMFRILQVMALLLAIIVMVVVSNFVMEVLVRVFGAILGRILMGCLCIALLFRQVVKWERERREK